MEQWAGCSLLCLLASIVTNSMSVSGVYTQWTSWSGCSNGQSSQSRTCSIGCAGSQSQFKYRPCSASHTIYPPTTRAVTPATTAAPSPTAKTTKRNSPTRPITIVSTVVKSPKPKPTTTPRRPITIHDSTAGAKATTGNGPDQNNTMSTSRRQTTVTTKWKLPQGTTTTTTTTRYRHYTQAPAKTHVVTTSSNDNVNLRITVTISSALVGSLLLVAVIACWRRLHLEQIEQRRQLMQPEATQPEYHGLQSSRQSSFPAPPPTYHDAYQLDVRAIHVGAAPTLVPSSTPGATANRQTSAGDESSGAGDSANAALTSSMSSTASDGTPIPRPQPVVGTAAPQDATSEQAPLLPSLPRPQIPPPQAAPAPSRLLPRLRPRQPEVRSAEPLPPAPPPPPPPPTSPSPASNATSVEAREKSHVDYIMSQLRTAATEDELLDGDESFLDTDVLLSQDL